MTMASDAAAVAVMPQGRGIRLAFAGLLTILGVACSSSGLPERYAHCEDLGTLRLASTSIDDAEARMRAQVEILGGDLLLFSARGHDERAGEVPSALAQRRNVLAAPPATSINGRQPELDTLTAGAAPESGTQEERWYYGAALRCKPTSPVSGR